MTEVTYQQLDRLLFQACQLTTLSRLVKKGKLVFTVDDYCELWYTDMRLKDMRPAEDVLVRQINSSPHTSPAPFPGSWMIRPWSIVILE